MSQQTLGWKPLQIIHHYFPRDEKKMEAFIDANPGDGFVVNVKEPWIQTIMRAMTPICGSRRSGKP